MLKLEQNHKLRLMRKLIIGATLTLASLFSGSAIAQEVHIPRHAQIEFAKFICESLAQGYSSDYIVGSLDWMVERYYQNQGTRYPTNSSNNLVNEGSRLYNSVYVEIERQEREDAISQIIDLASEKQCQF